MKHCCGSMINYAKGLRTGLLFGLIPHSFCIAFLLLSIAGATSATALLGQFLSVPYLSLLLVILSLLLATFSAYIYLKKTGGCSLALVKSKWKYLLTLYASIVVINVIVVFILLPTLSKAQAKTDDVPIFCPAHSTEKIN